jgi:hypothetical protein
MFIQILTGYVQNKFGWGAKLWQGKVCPYEKKNSLKNNSILLKPIIFFGIRLTPLHTGRRFIQILQNNFK